MPRPSLLNTSFARAQSRIGRQLGWLGLLSLSAAISGGCLARSATRVTLPGRDGAYYSAYRVQCNYAIANCRRKAEQTCKGPYQEISRGDRSCRDCGVEWQNPVATGESSVYRGVLEFRCK